MRYLTLLFLFISFTSVKAQTQIDSYRMSYLNSTQPIKISSSSMGDQFFIGVDPISSMTKKISLMVSKKDLPTFKSNLDSAKNIYIKWSKMAKEKGITDLRKDMTLDVNTLEASFYTTKWNLEDNVDLVYYFRVSKSSGKHVLCITNKYKLQSISNKYITSKGFLMAFESVAEIDAFISKLDMDKALEVINKEKEKSDMFAQ